MKVNITIDASQEDKLRRFMRVIGAELNGISRESMSDSGIYVGSGFYVHIDFSVNGDFSTSQLDEAGIEWISLSEG